ncbi:MAG: hypothetical protein AB7K24_21250, partial [Gemmataceae bacterium]
MRILPGLLCLSALLVGLAPAQDHQEPKLPGGKTIATVTSPDFLRATTELKPDTKIAKVAPTVDFAFYPGQDYPGNPWSNWGDGLAVGNKFYSSIGDHKSPGGNAYVYEYDADKKTLHRVVDLRKTLNLPDGIYTPGKIHSRLDLGKDGWLYFSTHRGSTRVAFNPAFKFGGDWILRYHPESGKTEVVAHAPLEMQSMPTGLLDPDRLIWYAGTADGLNKKGPQFLAYDVKNKKKLYSDDYGPYRYLIFAKSTGKVYFHGKPSAAGKAKGPAQLVRFDPEKPGEPQPIDATVGLRSATLETPQGIVYTVDGDNLWAFNTKTEKAEFLGPCVAGSQNYIASIDADPKTGRYLYFVAGAHGGSQADGTPLVQYDVKTKTRKVICFLHPVLHEKFGYVP